MQLQGAIRNLAKSLTRTDGRHLGRARRAQSHELACAEFGEGAGRAAPARTFEVVGEFEGAKVRLRRAPNL